VQGCLRELEQLLAEVGFDQAADRLEPVGDVVNRGPDSLGVLRLLRSAGAGGVLGNHDLHLLRTAAGHREPRAGDTLQPVLEAEDCDELIAWLAERPFAKGWDDVLLVHAGLSPTWERPLEQLAGLDPFHPEERADFAVRVRHCDREGNRPTNDYPEPGPPFAPWFEFWLERGDARTVVFGHWARLGLIERPGLRGLDTGCVWGRALTAWIPEEDRLVSVPAAKAYAQT